MKAKLFFVPVLFAIFLSVFAAKEIPLNFSKPETTCCQRIALAGSEGVLSGCEVCVYEGSTLIGCGTTNSSGQVDICGLTQGHTYTISAKCCPNPEQVPTFTACELAVVNVTCP